MEDYKEKYKQALKRARIDYDDKNTSNYERRKLEKIFPELAESEDEKIRKVLIKGLTAMKEIHHHTTFSDDAININDAISWLEKQKPAEWSEEDKKISDAIYESLDFLALESLGVSEDDVVAWLKSLKSRVQLQPKQEWSEEDSELEKAIKDIIESWLYDLDGIAIMGSSQYLSVDDLKDIARYFYHLGEKSHNTIEWSEEDENNLTTIISEIEANKLESEEFEHETYNNLVHWLKSLKPQQKKEWVEMGAREMAQ